MISKPAQGAFPSYYQHYLDGVPEDIFRYLEEQLNKFKETIKSIPENKFDYRYEEGKWSIKEVLLHLNDTERVFGYRALCLSRKENQNLPGFDQENYVKHAQIKSIHVDTLVDEFEFLRMGNLRMFKQITAMQWDFVGTANQFKVPLRMFPFVMAGHVDHHMKIIKSRYLAE